MLHIEQMMAVEAMNRCRRQYGEEYPWRPLSYDDEYFVRELRREMSEDDPLQTYEICAAVRSITDDRVLFVAEKDGGKALWRLYRLDPDLPGGTGAQDFEEFPNCREAVKHLTAAYTGQQ